MGLLLDRGANVDSKDKVSTCECKCILVVVLVVVDMCLALRLLGIDTFLMITHMLIVW